MSSIISLGTFSVVSPDTAPLCFLSSGPQCTCTGHSHCSSVCLCLSPCFFPKFKLDPVHHYLPVPCPVSGGTDCSTLLTHPQPYTLYFQFQQIHWILFYRFFCPSRTAAFKSHLPWWLPRMCVCVCVCVSMCGSAITTGHLDPMPGCLHQRGPYPGPPPCTKCLFQSGSLKTHRPQVSISWGSLSDFRVEP